MRRLFPSSTFVPPQLPNPARDLNRLLIGEAPGLEESEHGKPFVGPAGRFLNDLLRSANVDREGLTILNCIQCRPPDNCFPTDSKARVYISKEEAEKAIAHCYQAHVLPMLDSRDWTHVDLVGDKSLRFIGKQTGGVSRSGVLFAFLVVITEVL